MDYLPCEIIETADEVDAAVIWLHGLGANGHDFVPIIPELRLPKEYKIRFVFPHAPSIPVTINAGMVMPAWYDILDMSFERQINYEQINASAQAVDQLIERERSRGIESERIVLAGFSQGGAVVYQSALSYPHTLGGLMTLSTYFPTYDQIKLSDANKNLDIHVFHGVIDNVVPEALGKMAVDRLQSMGLAPEYKSYPVEHGVHPDEVKDISNWLQKLLRPK